MVLSSRYGATLDIKKCRVETVFNVASSDVPSVTSFASLASRPCAIGWRRYVLYVILVLILFCETCLCMVCSVSTWKDFHWYMRFNSTVDTALQGQCLVLSGESIIDNICELPLTSRKKKMRETRTRFCGLPLYSVLSAQDKLKVATCSLKKGCRQSLRNVEQRDSHVGSLFCAFEDVLDRFDCEETYSVTGNCTKCKRAYKEWLCSLYLDFYYEGERVLPCSDFCENVAKSCPFFRPNVTETQVGEPGFICKDAYIAQNFSLMYGGQGCCYLPCQTFDHGSFCPPLNLTSSCISSSSTSAHTGPNLANIVLYLMIITVVHRTVLQYASIGMT